MGVESAVKVYLVSTADEPLPLLTLFHVGGEGRLGRILYTVVSAFAIVPSTHPFALPLISDFKPLNTLPQARVADFKGLSIKFVCIFYYLVSFHA